MGHSVIERMAKVIASSTAERDGKDAGTAAEFASAAWPDYEREAVALLTVIRESTREMIDAGEAAKASGFDVCTIFAHMIDAAIKEPSAHGVEGILVRPDRWYGRLDLNGPC